MCKVHFLHIAFFIQFPTAENVPDMFGNNTPVRTEKLPHCLLCQPDVLVLQYSLYLNVPFVRSVENEIRINYSGRLDEISFLNRLYKLKELPSTDSRYIDAESDIWKHTVANDDWGYVWVFYDRRFQLCNGSDDEILLAFLCEIFHPAVRNEKQPWEKLLNKLN
jgi:hypothetical protein